MIEKESIMANTRSNQEEIDELDDVVLDGQREQKMILSAQKIYIDKGNPKPVREKATLGKIITRFGLESIFQVASLLGAMYVSALRVGILMEITQINLIAKFLLQGTTMNLESSIAGMRWASMLAFEGALLSAGFIIGVRLAQRKPNQVVNITALAVTMTAGFLSSLTLVNSGPLSVFISWLFAAVSSVGAPLVVLYMAQNGGFLWKEIINLGSAFDDEYKVKLAEWKVGFEKDYPYISSQVWGEERRRRLGKFEAGTNSEKKESRTEDRNFAKEIRDYLEANSLTANEVGDGPGFIITPHVIAEKLGINPSTMRTNLSRIRENMKKQQGE